MTSQLVGEVELWNGQRAQFTARITAEVVDGCRVYQAVLPLYLDDDGAPQLLRTVHIDVLPAHSTLRLVFDPDLPPVTVLTGGDVV